ncbi:MAG TPA: hypothetical protein VGK25_12425 [Ignavibacteria bacterium]
MVSVYTELVEGHSSTATSLLKDVGIHCQCLHQQKEMIAEISKDFMRIIRTHNYNTKITILILSRCY